jgi:hypothetical protein
MKIIERYGTTLRIYDNGGKTLDRYTILPPRWAKQYNNGRYWEALGCDSKPFHSVGMYIEAIPGAHLGKRIHWGALPEEVKRFCRGSYPELVEA